MSQSNILRPTPQPSFTFDEALAGWNISSREWLVQNHKDHEIDGLSTASIVFNPDNKVLLIQRASQDSMPNRWEIPGGATDPDDPSVLHAAARELWEESGLVATRFTHIITEGPGRAPGNVFRSSTKLKTWCQFTFRVEAADCDAVKLDPNEHQDFVWASETEVRARKAGNRELVITSESVVAVILEAFRLEKGKLGSL